MKHQTSFLFMVLLVALLSRVLMLYASGTYSSLLLLAALRGSFTDVLPVTFLYAVTSISPRMYRGVAARLRLGLLLVVLLLGIGITAFSIVDLAYFRELGTRIRPAFFRDLSFDAFWALKGSRFQIYCLLGLVAVCLFAIMGAILTWKESHSGFHPILYRDALFLAVTCYIAFGIPPFASPLGQLATDDLEGFITRRAVEDTALRSVAIAFQTVIQRRFTRDSRQIHSVSQSKEQLNFTASEKEWLRSHCLIEQKTPTQPLFPVERVILLTIESLSRDLIHHYAPTQIPGEATLFLDTLLREYPHLDNYWTTLMPTLPGLYAMFLSRPVFDWKVVNNQNHATLFSVLEAAGFETMFMRATDRKYGNDGSLYSKIFQAHNLFWGEDFQLRYEKAWSWGVSDAILLREAQRLIKEHRGRKYFLEISTTNTHSPFYSEIPPEQLPGVFNGRHLIQAVHGVDVDLLTFIDGMRSNGDIDEKTLIIVTADHSVPGGTLVPDRIPIIFLPKDRYAFPAVSKDGYASQVDFAPSLLALLGIAVPESFLGRNFFDATCEPLSMSYQAGSLIFRFSSSTIAIPETFSTPLDTLEEGAHRALAKWTATKVFSE